MELKNQDLQNLVALAKYAGGRFDLVQSGGGNVSVKTENIVWVKSSGISLSELDSSQQCAAILIKPVQIFMTELAQIYEDFCTKDALLMEQKLQLEQQAKACIDSANTTPQNKPSIESFLHVLGNTFTLHTHPILVNAVVIKKNAQTILANLFPDSLFVDYFTPGVELAIAINEREMIYQQQYGNYPEVIFLKNHGVIVSANSVGVVLKHYEEIETKLQQYLNVDFSSYIATTDIARQYALFTHAHTTSSNSNSTANTHSDTQINQKSSIAYLCQNKTINALLASNKLEPLMVPATSPDQFVYNGICPCLVEDKQSLSEEYLLDGVISDIGGGEECFSKAITQYQNKYKYLPKVLIIKNKLYFMAMTMKKALEMEQVMIFHVMAIIQADCAIENIQSLSAEEFNYLSSWDAEKYRQKL